MTENIIRIHQKINFDKMREPVEWLNYWWSRAGEKVSKGYLFVGDSEHKLYYEKQS